MFFLLKIFVKADNAMVFVAAITLGSAACCTAQSALAVVGQTYKLKDKKLFELLRYISGVDGLFGLGLFGLALCVLPGARQDFLLHDSLKWLFSSIAMGLVPAILLVLLSRFRFSHNEYLLFLIGIVMLSAGLAKTIHHSPLIAGFICGIVTANLCPYRLRAMSIVVHAEKSIYIFLLLLIGASWYFRLDYSLVLVAAYFIIRMAGKLAGLYGATSMLRLPTEIPAYSGLGLISEGGLAIAIIISFRMVHPTLMADSLVTVIVFAVLVSEFLGPKFILTLFRDRERKNV
jgi:hypothetical protein